MNKTVLKRIWRWHQIDQQIRALKDEEVTLRKQLYAELFPGEEEGTREVDLPDDYVLKGTGKLTRSLDERLVPAIGERIPSMYYNRVFQTAVKLSLREYKKLPPEVRDVVDEAVTTRFSTPTLQLIMPKLVDDK